MKDEGVAPQDNGAIRRTRGEDAVDLKWEKENHWLLARNNEMMASYVTQVLCHNDDKTQRDAAKIQLF